MTMIKEDAERIASAITDTLNMFGSCILVIITFYLLIMETFILSLPLLAILIITAIHLKFSSKLISESYKSEITKEEKYKSSILELIKQTKSNPAQAKVNFTVSNLHMNEAVAARYEYEKLGLKLCFLPEAVVAASTALIIGFIAIFSPKTFGSNYIYYLGYLGIFSMACRHFLETMLSLVGINESIKRIFSHE